MQNKKSMTDHAVLVLTQLMQVKTSHLPSDHPHSPIQSPNCAVFVRCKKKTIKKGLLVPNVESDFTKVTPLFVALRTQMNDTTFDISSQNCPFKTVRTVLWCFTWEDGKAPCGTWCRQVADWFIYRSVLLHGRCCSADLSSAVVLDEFNSHHHHHHHVITYFSDCSSSGWCISTSTAEQRQSDMP